MFSLIIRKDQMDYFVVIIRIHAYLVVFVIVYYCRLNNDYEMIAEKLMNLDYGKFARVSLGLQQGWPRNHLQIQIT